MSLRDAEAATRELLDLIEAARKDEEEATRSGKRPKPSVRAAMLAGARNQLPRIRIALSEARRNG